MSEQTNTKKKVIIIGGGVAGLSAGVYAQKAGFDALILEAHTIVGGECTGWERQGYHIDNCIHWMTGTNPQKDLYKVWEEVGALGPDVPIIRNESFTRIDASDGKHIHISRNLNRMREDMLAIAPEDKELIDIFIDGVDRYQDVEVPTKPGEQLTFFDIVRLIWRMRRVGKVRKRFLTHSITNYVRQFQNPFIRRAITNYLPERYYAEGILFIYGMFANGNADIPAGGSRQMAMRMQKRFESLGGQVRTGYPVQHINVEEGIAKSVTLRSGEIIEADFVISACDAHVTYEQLFDPQYKDPYFEERYKDKKTFPLFSNFNIYFGSDKRIEDLPDMLIWECKPYQIAGRKHSLIVFKHYQYEPGFAPEGHMVSQVLINQNEADFDYWEQLRKTDIKRYRAEKLQIAEEIRQRVEEHLAELQGHLTVVETLTPESYHRFVGAYKGAYMSFIRTEHRPKMEAHLGRVPGVRNAYLAGQWLQAPGGLPNAVVTGKFAIDRILHDHFPKGLKS